MVSGIRNACVTGRGNAIYYYIQYIFLSCSLPFERDPLFCAISQLALTIGFVRYPRSTGCSASVSLLYAVLHPIRLSIRLGREHSFLSLFFHPRHHLFYTLRSVVVDETVTYATQFFGCPYTKRKLSIISQLFSLQTVVARADGLRQAVLWISSCH